MNIQRKDQSEYVITPNDLKSFYNLYKDSKTHKYLGDKNDGTQILHDLFTYFNKDKYGKNHPREQWNSVVYKDIMEMADNDAWSQVAPFKVFPLQTSKSGLSPKKMFLKMNKREFKTAYDFFLTKNVDLVYETQLLNVNDWDDNNRTYNNPQKDISLNEHFLYMVDKYGYSLKDEKIKELFVFTMDKLMPFNSTEAQRLQLLGLKGALSQNVEKELTLQWLGSFLHTHTIVQEKNDKLFEQVKSYFTQEELENNLTPHQKDRLKKSSDQVFLEKEVDGTVITVNIKALKKEKNISSGTLDHNFKIFSRLLDESFRGVQDYVNITPVSKASVLGLQIMYEKNSEEITKRLAKVLLTAVTSLTESVTADKMREQILVLKSKFFLHNKLTMQLEEEKPTKTKRNKL